MGGEDDLFLLLSPGGLVDAGVEVVVPSLATLLARPPAQVVVALHLLGDQRPLLDPILVHQGFYRLVFLV